VSDSPLPFRAPNEKPGAGDLAESAFRRHYHQVYRFLRHRTGDDGRAEELTQIVFADAAAAQLTDDPERPLLAWLYTVARRRSVDEARGRRHRQESALDEHDDLAASLRSQPGLAGVLRTAIAALPDGQREVIVLKLLRGHSFAEIALATGASVDASKMRFSRGLAALRADLTRQGIAP
jgi:RNA polymerase sigma-70 factor (ECF subfamily)